MLCRTTLRTDAAFEAWKPSEQRYPVVATIPSCIEFECAGTEERSSAPGASYNRPRLLPLGAHVEWNSIWLS
jgi:hypothetical protein